MIQDTKSTLIHQNKEDKKIILEMKNIRKGYNKPVLKGVDLIVKENEFIAIVGKSGCGKSTLMNIIGCIENSDSGEYIFCENVINQNKDYSSLRLQQIGFIYQNYNLISNYSCVDNILLPTLYTNDNTVLNLDMLLDLLDIRGLLNKDINVLSGGEKQRVAIARALILNPKLIIADEPTGNLDENTKNKVMKILLDYVHNYSTSLIIVTHDSSISSMADKTYFLKDGVLDEI